MTRSRIFLSPPHLGDYEASNVQAAIDSNWVAPVGPDIDAFENDITLYTGAKYAAALSSGTAGIHLALIVSGIKPGDTVLCSSFTFAATANPITYLGAEPIFVDSESETWNMSPTLLRQAIEDQIILGQKPKACIVVHLYGMPAKLKEISSICQEFEITLIEDAAEALGSSLNGQKLGTFGAFGIYSFNGNKIITTSGGGCIVSENQKAIQEVKYLATQARDQAAHYQHSRIGYNYRLSNILAAIGSGQMRVLEDRVAQKRSINSWYRYILSPYPYVTFQDECDALYKSNYWLTCILFDSTHHKYVADLLEAFDKANIEARPLWKPLHMQPVFKDCPSYVDGTSEMLFNHGVCLPSGTAMTEKDKARIQAVLNAVLD